MRSSTVVVVVRSSTGVVLFVVKSTGAVVCSTE